MKTYIIICCFFNSLTNNPLFSSYFRIVPPYTIIGLGRKRKLSTYRSKKDIKRNQSTNTKWQKLQGVTSNYERITKESENKMIDALNEGNEDINTDDNCEVSSEDNILEQNAEFSMESKERKNEGNNDAISSDEDSDFKQRCRDKLSDLITVVPLVERLQDSGNLYDFMNLIRLLQSGELSCDNIVFQLFLDRVRFQKCSSTVGMRYREVTKLFWFIVYQLCKGVGLKFFGGEKNWGQVVNKTSEKSKYMLTKSHLNFAVPDEKVLHEISQKLAKIIPPGKIHSTLNMLWGKKDLILTADGKLVTKGLKSDFVGDVDLFGQYQI